MLTPLLFNPLFKFAETWGPVLILLPLLTPALDTPVVEELATGLDGGSVPWSRTDEGSAAKFGCEIDAGTLRPAVRALGITGYDVRDMGIGSGGEIEAEGETEGAEDEAIDVGTRDGGGTGILRMAAGGDTLRAFMGEADCGGEGEKLLGIGLLVATADFPLGPTDPRVAVVPIEAVAALA